MHAQLFTRERQCIGEIRLATPSDYPAMLEAFAAIAAWSHQKVGSDVPVGVGVAGVVSPSSGILLSANHPASGKSLGRDLNRIFDRPVSLLNDAHAFAMAEATMGAGQGFDAVAAVIVGTGIGGGFVVNGRLRQGPAHTTYEFGHTALPATLVAAHGLPLVACPCGRTGCMETLLSGPGLVRLSEALIGHAMTPSEVIESRQGRAIQVWSVWCALMAELLHQIVIYLDPDVIVLGGGLGQRDELLPDLATTLNTATLRGFGSPLLRSGRLGAGAGALGAACAALSPVAEV